MASLVDAAARLSARGVRQSRPDVNTPRPETVDAPNSATMTIGATAYGSYWLIVLFDVWQDEKSWRGTHARPASTAGMSQLLEDV